MGSLGWIPADDRWKYAMMSKKGAGLTSLFVSRLALILSAVVVIRPARLRSSVTAHYLSSLDRRVILVWDRYNGRGTNYLCELGSGNSESRFAPT